jgi:Flp pilus assembly pilin Flp
MKRVLVTIKRLVVHDGGQDLIEYGLLMALIAVAAIAAVTQLGNTLNNVFWSSIAQNF